MKEIENAITPPWPFPNPVWPDPPWQMQGTVLTAWFHAEPSILAQLAHPDFPPAATGRQTRIRFYDIQAKAGDAVIAFREAVVAYQTCYGGEAGEISALMWTDSVPYLTWGREVFGWPLQLADVNLQGGIWTGDLSDHADCTVGDLRLTVNRTEEVESHSRQPATWITPHRIVTPVRPGTETRMVYAVKARTLEPGRHFRCDGSVDAAVLFGAIEEPEIDLVVGTRIEVGSDVVAIPEADPLEDQV